MKIKKRVYQKAKQKPFRWWRFEWEFVVFWLISGRFKSLIYHQSACRRLNIVVFRNQNQYFLRLFICSSWIYITCVKVHRHIKITWHFYLYSTTWPYDVVRQGWSDRCHSDFWLKIWPMIYKPWTREITNEWLTQWFHIYW